MNQSVDSICRDTTYTLIISPNLRNGTLISLYNHIPFIFECFHDEQDIPCTRGAHFIGCRQPLCVPILPADKFSSVQFGTRHSQNGQIVLLFSFFFAQRCLNLSRWFSHETPAFSTEQCNDPSRFFATSKSEVFTTLKTILSRHFHVCTHAH